ncbi:MAG: TetR/AcrR family transcriptional regulator [Treponemataceae bacterium]
MIRKTEQVSQTKENIKQAFWKLYQENQIEKISVKQISTLAGYNRATFYTYYKDVYDLLDQIEMEILQGLRELIFSLVQAQVAKGHQDSIIIDEQLTNNFFKVFQSYYSANSPYLKTLLTGNGSIKFSFRLKKMIKEFFFLLLPSEIKNMPTTEYIVEGLTAMQIGIFSLWFEKDGVLPFEQLIDLSITFSQFGNVKGLREDLAMHNTGSSS